MGFSDSSVLLKIALVVLPIALILHIVGLATPSWSSYSDSSSDSSVSYGLWSVCLKLLGVSKCDSYTVVEDWVKACQAFGIIGVLAVAAAVILEVLCTVALSKATHKIVFMCTILAAFVGAACIVLSAIIWGAKSPDLGGPGYDLDISWSFALSIIGGILAGIGGVLVAIDFCSA